MRVTQVMESRATKERENAAWSSAAAGWMKHDQRLTESSRPVSEMMIERAGISSGSRVLDLASGTGEPGLRIAERVGPGGFVLATDQSEQMLAFAREKAAGRKFKNLEFRRETAESISATPGGFDAVTCRFGIMLMADPVRVLRGAWRALRPGGKVAVATWAAPEKNPSTTLAMSVIRQYVDVPLPDPDGPGVFAFADPDRLRRVLEEAGFGEVGVESVPVSGKYPDGAAYWEFQLDVAAPLATLYEELPPAVRQQVALDVCAAAERFRLGDELVLGGEAWVAWGTKG